LKAVKKTKATKPKLPTSKRSDVRARAQAKVLEKVHLKNFPGLATATPTTSKGLHFSTFDDECICYAYCHVSVDSETGANQKGEDFWAKVAEHANVLLAEGGKPERSTDSVITRFTRKISPAALAFKPYYKEAMSVPQSGWDETMYETYAMELYKGDDGKPFQFLHCSKILQSIPKYDWESEEVESDDLGTTATGGPMGGHMERPMGTKSAKAASKVAKPARGKKVSVQASLDDTVADLRANGQAIVEHVASIAARNALYLEFNCLMKMGKLAAADKVFKRMQALGNPPPSINLPDSLVLESSSDDDDGAFPMVGNLKDDRSHRSHNSSGASSSGSSSGGDRYIRKPKPNVEPV
jgi:pentatricopeptide repeat protein